MEDTYGLCDTIVEQMETLWIIRCFHVKVKRSFLSTKRKVIEAKYRSKYASQIRALIFFLYNTRANSTIDVERYHMSFVPLEMKNATKV